MIFKSAGGGKKWQDIRKGMTVVWVNGKILVCTQIWKFLLTYPDFTLQIFS
jgi:hypothetical protein